MFPKWSFPWLSPSASTQSRSQPHERTSPTRMAVWRFPRTRIVFWTCLLAASVGFGLYVRAEIHRRTARYTDYPAPALTNSGGTLLISGGGSLTDMIRHRFVELAGGRKARIVVIPAATVDETAASDYRSLWMSQGVESVEILQAESREQAEQPEFSQVLESATGVWLGGGQQSLLAQWYGQTIVERRLKELLQRNGVIGGTSAGAAIMSQVMIAGGFEKPKIARGFDLIPGAIIDQHFIRRHRTRRLRAALEQHPELIGFGIDEGTALQYAVRTGRFQVLGQSCVVAMLPRTDRKHPRECDFEFLNPGDDFDVERLRNGDPIPPSAIDFDAILLGE